MGGLSNDQADNGDSCLEHLWRFEAVEFGPAGSWSEYRCERCGSPLLVEPGGIHPETV